MWKITEVYDTRSFNPETGKPEPGTGDPHSCDHCGKTHVVYCEIENKDGERMTVGTTCAKKLVYNCDSITTSALKANMRNKWYREEAEKMLVSFVQTPDPRDAMQFVDQATRNIEDYQAKHHIAIKMFEVINERYTWK